MRLLPRHFSLIAKLMVVLLMTNQLESIGHLAHKYARSIQHTFNWSVVVCSGICRRRTLAPAVCRFHYFKRMQTPAQSWHIHGCTALLYRAMIPHSDQVHFNSSLILLQFLFFCPFFNILVRDFQFKQLTEGRALPLPELLIFN